MGGRSAGARVACRTAEQTRPSCVLCLAFPLLFFVQFLPPVVAEGLLLAAAAMSFSSVSVIANALRLRRVRL